MARTKQTARKQTTIRRKPKPCKRQDEARLAASQAPTANPLPTIISEVVGPLDLKKPSYLYDLGRVLTASSAELAKKVLKQLDDACLVADINLRSKLFKNPSLTVSLVASTMNRHIDNSEVQAYGCSLLNKFVQHYDFDMSAIEIIGIGDAINAITSFPMNTKIVKAASGYLVKACQNAPNLHLSDQHGAIEKIIKLMDSHLVNVTIQKMGCNVLSRIAEFSTELRVLVYEGGGHKAMYCACKAHNNFDPCFQELFAGIDWTKFP